MPTTYNQVVFGSFSYNATNGIYPESVGVSLPYKVRTAQTPGRAGRYRASALSDDVKISIKGKILGTSWADYRTKFDAFKAAHAPGAAASLYIDSDEHYTAQVTGIGEITRSPQMNFCSEFTVEFEARPGTTVG